MHHSKVSVFHYAESKEMLVKTTLESVVKFSFFLEIFLLFAIK